MKHTEVSIAKLTKLKKGVTSVAVSCVTWGWELGGKSTLLATLPGISLGHMLP